MDQRELVKEILNKPDSEIYLVGGAVRDLFLGHKLKDLDFVISIAKNPIDEFNRFSSFLSDFTKGKFDLQISNRISDFLTFKVKFSSSIDDRQSDLDFVFARAESYSGTACKPEIELGSLADDLGRRDFTINALALKDIDNLSNVIDYHDGCRDLKSKEIRILHSKSFNDDPVRMIRAIRLCHRLNFELESGTFEILHEAIDQRYLSQVSEGRRYAEFMKVLNEEKFIGILKKLCDLNLLKELVGLQELNEAILSAELETLQTMRLTSLDALALILAKAKSPEEVVKKISLSKNLKFNLVKRINDLRNS